MKTRNYIVLTVSFSKEDDEWVAICEETGTAIQAKTIEEAREIIINAVEENLNELQATNECERFFKENGIKVFREYPKTIPTPVDSLSSDIFTKHYPLAVSC